MPYPIVPPLAVPIPVEPGYHDRVAAACLRQALEDAEHGDWRAFRWLADATPPDGGLWWADALSTPKAQIGAKVRDALCEIARRDGRRWTQGRE